MVTAPKVINAKTKWRCGQANQDLPRPLRLQHRHDDQQADGHTKHNQGKKTVAKLQISDAGVSYTKRFLNTKKTVNNSVTLVNIILII